MRELTFSGFLTQYVKQLSVHNTLDLSVLAEEAALKNPRLREPLALYVLFSGKQSTFQKNADRKNLSALYFEPLKPYSTEEVLRLFTSRSPELPSEFHKVWRSYQTRKNRFTADDHTKTLMRNKILRLQSTKQISNYRIYTDLRLNPGNVNAWLKHGTCEKISLKNARQVLSYVENHSTASP